MDGQDAVAHDAAVEVANGGIKVRFGYLNVQENCDKEGLVTVGGREGLISAWPGITYTLNTYND